MKAYLILEDGKIFEGASSQTIDSVVGDVIFNTQMAGYQEILTNPAYLNQIVVMTYPIIGNYGVNGEDNLSSRCYPKAIVAKEISEVASNFRMESNLPDFLKDNEVPSLVGIDTRALTKYIRSAGRMKGVITTQNMSLATAQKLMSAFEPLPFAMANLPCSILGKGKTIVTIDLGLDIKLLDSLNSDNTMIIVDLPQKIEEITALNPDAIIIAGNGGVVDNKHNAIIKAILALNLPTLAIGNGFLLSASALGYSLVPLRYGHHGSQPINDIVKGVAFESNQAHDYTIKPMENSKITVTYTNIHDSSIEGFTTNKLTAVQFIPDGKSNIFSQFFAKVKEA